MSPTRDDMLALNEAYRRKYAKRYGEIEKARKAAGMSIAQYNRIYQPERGANEGCFKCAKSSCGGCSWAKDFTPVEGWIAETVKYNNSYRIYWCPEFEEG